jgi:hypothetical protein
MSKLDAQRAMREANYAARNKGQTTTNRVAARPPVAPSSSVSPARPAAAAPASATCGHKSMNGRACTRDAGHAEKSHRYS